MSDNRVDQNKLEESLYGQWVDADERTTVSVLTINQKLGQFEADAFQAVAAKLIDENSTALKLRHIETGALFVATWEYQEEENTND